MPDRFINIFMTLGLTGCIGCGKSAVATLLGERGFRTMDSDWIVRTHLFPAPDVISAIRERFGPGVIAETGQVDRRRLAERVFASDQDLNDLERLLHPRVYAYWKQAFAAHPGDRWAVEVPLLFEKSLQNWFDFTVCVASHPRIQLARREQRGLPAQLARQRISKQLPLAQKIELADFVILNDGSPDFLREQVDVVIASISNS
jgi:dephospho-CoA kinase